MPRKADMSTSEMGAGLWATDWRTGCKAATISSDEERWTATAAAENLLSKRKACLLRANSDADLQSNCQREHAETGVGAVHWILNAGRLRWRSGASSAGC